MLRYCLAGNKVTDLLRSTEYEELVDIPVFFEQGLRGHTRSLVSGPYRVYMGSTFAPHSTRRPGHLGPTCPTTGGEDRGIAELGDIGIRIRGGSNGCVANTRPGYATSPLAAPSTTWPSHGSSVKLDFGLVNTCICHQTTRHAKVVGGASVNGPKVSDLTSKDP